MDALRKPLRMMFGDFLACRGIDQDALAVIAECDTCEIEPLSLRERGWGEGRS
jgi:hypothetical protein